MADQTKTLVEEQPLPVVQEDTAHVLTGVPETSENSPSDFKFNLRKEGDSETLVKQMTERFFPLKNLEWPANAVAGTILKSIDFPDALFKLKGIPNIAFLNNYVYWHADIKVEVEVAALPQTYGCLLVGWCYDFNYMGVDEMNLRKMRCGLANMDHMLVYPQGNSKISFVLPYRSFKTSGRISQDKYLAMDIKKMVTLFISVLQPLRGNLNANDYCQVQVSACFENMVLTGIRASSQMMKALGTAYSTVRRATLTAIEEKLEQLFPDFNRDFPTNTAQPSELIVRNCQSFCIGSGVGSVTSSLRLDPTKTTPFACLTGDEMNVNYVCSKWGLLADFEWNSNKSQQSVIFKTLVGPSVYYDTVKTDKILTLYNMPPISVVSSAFTFWRGTLEYKFVIPVNFVTKGKLLISFVPHSNYENFDYRTYDLIQAGSSYTTIYELGSAQEFIFKVPFISDTPFRRIFTRDFKNGKNYIGSLIVQTWSKLIVPKDPSQPIQTIGCSVFVRAGQDFELAAPAQCSIGLGLDRRITPDTSYIHPKSGYEMGYLDWWSKLGDSSRFIWRWGPGSDHISQFDGLHYNQVYKITGTKIKIWASNIEGTDDEEVDVQYLGCPKLDDGYDDYLAVIAPKYVDVWAKMKPSDQLTLLLMIPKKHPVLETYYNLNDLKILPYTPKVTPSSQTLEIGLGNQPNQESHTHFGETFSDLKDLFRRFNIYGDYYITITPNYVIGRTIFRIPIKPMSLSLNIDDPTQLGACRRYTREGIITVLSSCFRFFRGSLRFRLIFSKPSHGVFVGVFHDQNDTAGPDYISTPRYLESCNFVNSSYAGVGQDISINNVIDIQIPYYKETEFIRNGSHDGTLFSSHNLGCIKIVTMCSLKEETKLSLVVYYSLGDDSRFCCYNGYYPMVGLSDIPSEKPPNVQVAPFKSIKLSSRKAKHQAFTEKIDNIEILPSSYDEFEVESQMLSTIRETISGYANMPTTVNDSIKDFQTTIKGSVDTAKECVESQIQLIIGQLENVFNIAKDVVSDIKDRIYSLVIQIFTVVTNPTISCVVLSIAQVLNTLKIFSTEQIFKVGETIKKIYYLIFKPSSPGAPTEQNQAPQAESQMEFTEICNESELSALVAGLVSIIANSFSVFGHFKDAPLQYFSQHLGKDLKNTANLSNSLFIFFRNSMTVFIKVYQYISVKLFSPQDQALYLVNSGQEELRSWYLKANELVDPINKQLTINNPKKTMEVYMHKAIGDRMVATLMLSPSTISQANICLRTLTKLREFTDELTSAHLTPHVRYEPIVIQAVGETGIGKSYMTNKIIIECLKRIGVKTLDPIFTRTSGVEFFNGIRNQPAILYDDFQQIYGGGHGEQAMAEFFGLKNNCDFNPNIADLPNKNIRYSPLIVFLSMNQAYLTGTPIGMSKPKAFHRRRDIMYLAKLKPEYANDRGLIDYSKTPQDVLDSYTHMTYQFYNHPEDESRCEDLSVPMEFPVFMDKVVTMFILYFIREQKNYEKRLELFSSIAPDYSLDLPLDQYAQVTQRAVQDFIKENGNSNYQDHYKNFVDIYNSVLPQNLPNLETVRLYQEDRGTESQMAVEEVKEDLPLIQRCNLGRQKATSMTDYLTFKTKLLCYDEINFDFGETKPESSITPEIAADIKKNCPHRFISRDISSMEYYYYDNLLNKFIPIADEDRVPVVPEDLCPGNCLWKYGKYRSRVYSNFLIKNVFLFESPQYYSKIPTVVRIKANALRKEFGLPIIKDFHIDIINVFGDDDLSTQSDSSSSQRNLLFKTADRLKATASQIKQWMSSAGSQMYIFISKFWKYALIGLGVAGSLFIGARMLANSNLNDNPTPSTTTVDPYSPVNRVDYSKISGQYINYNRNAIKQAEGAKKLSRLESYTSIYSQSGTSDVGSALVKRNAGSIEFITDTSKLCSNYYLGIVGRFIITAGHFIESLLFYKTLNSNLTFTMYILGDPVIVNVSDIKVYYKPEVSACCLIELPKHVTMFRDIRNHIATEKDHGSVAPYDCSLLINKKSGIEVNKLAVKKEFNIPVKGTSTSNSFELYDAYMYPLGGQGLCGSVLSRNLPTFKIIGIHVAGIGSSKGFAEPIVFEQFSHLQAVSIIEPNSLSQDAPSIQVDSQIMKLGTVPKDAVIRISPKTRYEPTQIAGLIAPIYSEPAPLSKQDPRIKNIFEKSPLSYGIEKHGNPPKPFPTELMQRITADLKNKLLTVCKPVALGYEVGAELTDQQIFGGIPTIPQYKGLELDTSEGYPLQLSRPSTSHDKKWLFDYTTTNQGNILKCYHSLLQQTIDDNMDMRKKGIIPPTIFVDTLKDCLIKKEKVVKPGSTRVFSVSPIEYTIAIKKFFGHFQAAYVKAGNAAECAVGINVDSMQWMELYSHLNEVNCKDENGEPRFVTGDYKAFGDCLSTQCIVAIFEIMIDWYKFYFKIDSEGELIRWILCYELINAGHLAQNLFYKMFCGIPSGYALTVETNSMCNSLYMRAAFIEFNVAPSLSHYSQLTRQVNYGDDLILAVDNSISDKFNFNVIKSFLNKYNIEFTCGSKDITDERPFTPLKEVTFLKRSFVPHPFRRMAMLAPLPESSITESLNWYRRLLSKDPLTNLAENARATLNLAYGRGPQYHEQLRSKLENWFRHNTEMELRSYTWREIDAKAFDS